jgi:hypothetical protein
VWEPIIAIATLAGVALTLAVSLINFGELRKAVQECERRIGVLEEWKERKQERAEFSASQLTGGHSVV